MKHPACSGTIEIRTDPQNTAYVVTNGGKARDYGESEDRVREGENGLPILTAEERERRRDDAFAQLEGKAEERAQIKDTTKRIQELYTARERDWDDPWIANKRVRDSFRVERKILKREEDANEVVKDRIGTDIDLLPATQEDTARAKLITFGGDELARNRDEGGSKPMFRTPVNRISKSKPSRQGTDDRKEALRRQLLSNTRAALNPFG